MALRTLTGCASSSTTSGTGTYTISATPPTGRRSLSNAVSAGAAANGDTVYACIADFTTSGAGFQFEYGLYTIGSAGLTLARTTIIQSSNSNNAVDWDSGGTRDVVFSTGNWLIGANNLSDVSSASTARTNLAVPGLATANTLTAKQTLRLDGTGGQNPLDLANLAASAASNRVVSRYLLNDSVGVATIAFQVDSRLSTTTDGAEVGTTDLYSMAGGTLTKAMTITGASVADTSGNKYDAFPAGQVLLSESVPTGWTRGNVTDGRLIKLAVAADTLGAQAGGDDPFDGGWATVGHNLVVADLPTQAVTTASVNLVSSGSGVNTYAGVGGGGAHVHTITTPNYRVMGRIVKS